MAGKNLPVYEGIHAKQVETLHTILCLYVNRNGKHIHLILDTASFIT